MGHTDTIINGKKYPSVTEIIGILNKPFLAIWRGKIGNQEADRIMKESQEEGTKLHSAIERYFNLEIGTVDPHPRFLAWFTWFQTSQLKPFGEEIKVISKKYKYGGTFDAILQNQSNELILTDWKFSNSDDHFRYLQLAGYAQAYYEETDTRIERGLIVRVDKEAKVHVKEIEDLWKYVPMFLACRKLYDFCTKKGKWKIK